MQPSPSTATRLSAAASMICSLAVILPVNALDPPRRVPRAQVLVPGVSTWWFDQEPRQDVKQFLNDFADDRGLLPSVASELERQLPLTTQVRAVELDPATGAPLYAANGTVRTAPAWPVRFHWDRAHQELERRGVPTVVALQPGPPIDALIEAAEKRGLTGVAAWLEEHSHIGGVQGAQKNEAVIAAAIKKGAELGEIVSVGGHSQCGPNLLGTLARDPDLIPLLRGGEIAIVNPAFATPLLTLAAETPFALLPPAAKLLEYPSMKQLVRRDDFTAAGYRLQVVGKPAGHYLDFVESAAAQLGEYLRREGVQVRMWASRDDLVSVEATRRIVNALGGRFDDTQQVSESLGHLVSPGNRGNFPHGNSAQGIETTADYTKLSHSPRDLRAHGHGERDIALRNYAIMNDYLLSGTPISPARDDPAITDPLPGGVAIDVDVDQEMPGTGASGELQRIPDAVLDTRPASGSRRWQTGR